MAQSYFVIGTDTNVGKTYIATALVRYFVAKGLKTIGMKPIASGGEFNEQGEFINDDVLALSNASNVKASAELVNPYRFLPAIAPHLAAELADITMQVDVISHAFQQLTTLSDVVIVEGAGGFFVPVNKTETLADVATQLDIPIILVIGMRLGCINHALLTVEAIENRGLKLVGWIANQIDPDMPMFEENLTSLQQRISAPCLSVVHWQGRLDLNNLL